MNQKFRVISKRGLALFLALMMCITMLPVTAFAAGENPIADAIAAIEGEGTVKVSANTAEDVVIPSGKTITLELADNVKLTNVKDHTITVEEGATLILNGGKGVVDNTTHGKAAVLNLGTATLTGGTYKRSKETGIDAHTSGGNSYYTIENRGTMVLSANVENSGKFSSMIRNLGDGKEGKGVLTISSHTDESGVTFGQYRGGVNAVKNDDYGTLTIKGGDFVSNLQYAVQNWNVATIEGGTFKGTADVSPIFNSSYEEGISEGRLTVTGGSFTVVSSEGGSTPMFQNAYDATHTGNITVTGGSFSGAVVPAEFLPDGYSIVDGVVESDAKRNAVATAEDAEGNITWCASLQDALNAGGKITLLKDVTISGQQQVTKSFTFDGQGHTITGEGTTARAFNVNGRNGLEIKISNVNITNVVRGVNVANSDRVNVTLDQVTITDSSEYGVHLYGDSGHGQDDVLTITNSQVEKLGLTDVIDAAVTIDAESTFTAIESTVKTGASTVKVGETTYVVTTASNDVIGSVVAQVGNTCYPSLQAAIDAAEDGATVKLLKDYDDGKSIVVEGSKKLTLDLNGKTLAPNKAYKGSYIHGIYLQNSAELSVLDSSAEKTGKIAPVGTFTIGIAVMNNAKLKVEGITIEAGVYGITGNGSKPDEEATEITVKDCQIVATYAGQCTGIYHSQNGVLNIEGSGKITGYTGIEMRNGTLNIAKDATVEIVGDYTVAGTYYGFGSNKNGNGITTYGAGVAIVPHTNCKALQVNIAGGTLKGWFPLYEQNLMSNTGTVKMNVTGGSFETLGTEATADPYRGGEKDGYNVENEGYSSAAAIKSVDADTAVSGGAFSTDVKEYCVDGFAPFEKDGTFVVEELTKDNATVRVGNKFYTTLADAFAAAKDGDTVTLLKDVAEDATLNVEGTVTLNADGKTVAATVMVDAGTLNVTGNGIFDTTNRGNEGTKDHCLIAWKEGAKIVVENGAFKAGCTAAYAAKGGEIEINGGDFSADGQWGTKYLLNLQDNTGSKITVNGGTFHDYDPARSDSENPQASFVVEGKVAVKRTDGVYEIVDAGALKGTVMALNDGGKVEGDTVTYGADTTVQFTPDGNDLGRAPNHWWTGIKVTAPAGIDVTNATYQSILPWAAGTVKNWKDNTDGTFWGLVDQAYIDWFGGDDKVLTFTYKFDWDGNGVVDQTFTMKVENGIVLDTAKAAAKVKDLYYGTLAEAVEAAKAGDTVTLVNDAEGSGIVVHKNLTIDFAHKSYTVSKAPLAGSTGTETQAFQLLKGSKVTMLNGTIKATHEGVKMLVQNYADLTLSGMTLDTSENEAIAYVLSNNNGEVKIENSTISAAEGKNAFDVYYWPKKGYNSVNVTVTNSTINGNIEYATDGSAGYAQNATLTIESGTVNGIIDSKVARPGISISGGTFSTDVRDYCVAGKRTKALENGTYEVLPLPVVHSAPALANNGVITYNGSKQPLMTDGDVTGGHFEYQLNGGEWSENVPQATVAGQYTVSYRLVVDEDRADYTYSGTSYFSIRKANPTFTAPRQIRRIYNGTAQTLILQNGSVTGPGTTTDCKFLYRLGTDGEWSEGFPTATEAGTYTVYYYVQGGQNHNDSAVQSVEAIVDPNTVSMSVVMDSYTCNDNSVEPTVTKPDDATGEITFQYSGDNGATWSSKKPLTAGTYLVRAIMAASGNYAATSATSQPFTVSHNTETGAWHSDENGHWHVCACGEEGPHAAHEEGAGVVEGTQRVFRCTVCGLELRRETVVTPPDPPAPHEHNYVDGFCTICGEADPNGGTEINPNPNPLGRPLPFTDVKEENKGTGAKGDWFAPAVRYMYEHKDAVTGDPLISGTGTTTFSPNSFTTRGQLVAILWRIEGRPEAALSAFTDVSATSYYAEAIGWASANGIVSGYDETTFRPDRNVNRQEAAQILYKYAAYKGYDVTSAADLSKYTDNGSVADWAEKAMQWANAEEIISGRSATTLAPTGTTKRCEAAQILMEFCEGYKIFDKTAE